MVLVLTVLFTCFLLVGGREGTYCFTHNELMTLY